MELINTKLDIIDDIISNGIKLNMDRCKPSRNIIKEANKLVLDYIKKNDLILYGGTAINEVLKTKNQSIYDSDVLPDYDFFSCKPNKDAILLSNILHNNGFDYVRKIDAFHPGTYRISIDFHVDTIADITYMPKSLMKSLPVKIINGIKYIAPEVMFIDLYKSFSNIINYWRWEKDYIRYELLLDNFPIKGKPSKIKNNCPISILNILKTNVDYFSFTGIDAYNKLTHDSISCGHYEIFTDTPDIILEKIPKKYKIDEHVKFGNILDKCYRVYNDKNLILVIYDTSENIYFNLGKNTFIHDEFNYTCFEITMLYLHSLLIYQIHINDKLHVNTRYMIQNMNDNRSKFKRFIDTGINYKESPGYIINAKNYIKYTGKIYKPGLLFIDNPVEDDHPLMDGSKLN